ncbi:MAG: Eco57I restriction-modification methylase domain-containing protein [Candidatus Poribacteria bacterium]|nr:Eco57I restriction-modification methylase domain-containing protein [Candidatus Poribacteria bacterium]
MNQHKNDIKNALKQFTDGNLADNARRLLDTLGYCSKRTMSLEPNTAEEFIYNFDPSKTINANRALLDEWESIDILFQLTSGEITLSGQAALGFESSGIDNSIYQSYLFFVLKLRGGSYSRTKLSDITREINKLTPMPAMVIFQHGRLLTFAVIDRRLHRRDESRDVLEKVTLIKDINLGAPHRAHIDILFNLSHRQRQFANFNALHEAWKEALDTETLNRDFYKGLFKWFEWAVCEAKFPAEEANTLNPQEHVIRLITRLLFVWFLKEKGLVAEELFQEDGVRDLLKDYDREDGDSYYRAVLQNLFFATLNTEIEKREFSAEANATHRDFSRYRYKSQISNPDKLLELFAQTPFINGGLFDCLDSEEATDDGGYRIDCFSDRHYKKLSLPNRLFFHKDDGLFPLLKHYKFTVEENTPIEQEVALDPELLGKVFENLLAAYNPETGESARKQTGSYYTPRPIVDYMVEEALVAALAGQARSTNGDEAFWEERLHYLLDYAKASDDADQWFSAGEADKIVQAISELKILDPAVGSGAFPMGVLHKLTLALRRLDQDNSRWERLQKERAAKRAEAAFDTKDDRTRREELFEIDETFKRYRDSDFGRKLYLIQNSIFGVDIQSIACQIAKLRFFISLAIEQEPDEEAENFGIKPLPNLETRFIAANTLIGLTIVRDLTSVNAQDIERQLRDNRERYFHATTRRQKLNCRRRDKVLRGKLAAELTGVGMPADEAEKIAYWDPYDQNASTDFFDTVWMFGIADGFDVVIGNPPYVRQEKIKSLKPTLKKQYDCYTGTADLYVYFYERGFQLLRDNGILTYISSNKYFRSAYGKKLRSFLARQSTISQLIDFGDAPVFTSIAYPSIIVIGKTRTGGNHLRALNWEPGSSIEEFRRIFRTKGFSMPLDALTADGWRLTSPVVLNLLEKLRSTGKPLGEYVEGRFYYGIKTGLNDAFVVNRETRDRLIAEHSSSAEVLKPILRGRDVKRWQVDFAEKYIITIESSENRTHPWSGRSADEAEEVFADTYPAIHAHLQAHRDRLIERYDQGKYFWELRACAYWKEFERPKIVYPDIAQSAEFAFDDGVYILGNTLYLLPTKEMWLLGLLNSKAVFWFYTKTSTQIRGGFVRFIAQYVSQIPVPNIDPSQKTLVENLVNEILAAKHNDPDADITALENEIDRVVYSLYNLTREEIEIVEGVAE